MTILTLTKVDVGMMEDVGTSANQLVQLDSNAKIPAVDGSLLTGLGASSGASDPTISTNPSGGLGTKYINTTDGEIFICTNATAGANIWTNVGAGSGGVQPFHFTRCTTSYYIAGGNWRPNNPGPYVDTADIDKNLFASDGNSTDQGDLTSIRANVAGASSTTHGYCIGGASSGYQDYIEKFAMASPANATDVGDLTSAQGTAGGNTSDSYGWIHGGVPPGRRVEKVSFATDSGGTNVGDLLPDNRDYSCGGCSSTHGYSMGGIAAGTNSEGIHKWSYSTETATHDVGDLASTLAAADCSSDGYVWLMGRQIATSDRIDKMSTASDSDSVASGSTLYTVVSQGATGASSSTHGYIMGGYPKGDSGQGNYYRETIEKFSFASTGTGTDVGNLSHNRGEAGREGMQY